ncbi:thiopeptide-type bacteriocin biosynthesis protein [Flavobacterium sp. KS-LB2]|uniref:thiopeptide-type bacteriocin biosynthesis protein n=1 Tax=Flavobacterium sp. KS-LB2 TaxID=3120525 RepID=UPI0030CFBDA6
MDKRIQRNFIVGDSWLYYKIYSGPQSSDVILKEIIGPLVKHLIDEGIIEKWFFIRYRDPDHHLRIRLHYSNQNNVGSIINAFHSKLKHFFNQDLISKIQIDTYQREIERYGLNSIDLSETLFYYDSKMVVDFLKLMSKYDNGEEFRWLFSLKAIDSHLESFNYTLQEKQNLINQLKNSYRKEYDESKFLGKQLNDKYRDFRNKIDEFMNINDNGADSSPFLDVLLKKSLNIEQTVIEILKLKLNNELLVDFNNLNASYIHMFMNRLFKSKNRLHEMVCYDFLNRHYMSKIARERQGQLI